MKRFYIFSDWKKKIGTDLNPSFLGHIRGTESLETVERMSEHWKKKVFC